jgi:hypothetical protein
MGSADSKPQPGSGQKNALAAPSSGFLATYGGRRRSNRRGNRRGRGKTMRGGIRTPHFGQGGMHKGKRSKGSRRNKSRSKGKRHH